MCSVIQDINMNRSIKDALAYEENFFRNQPVHNFFILYIFFILPVFFLPTGSLIFFSTCILIIDRFIMVLLIVVGFRN